MSTLTRFNSANMNIHCGLFIKKWIRRTVETSTPYDALSYRKKFWEKSGKSIRQTLGREGAAGTFRKMVAYYRKLPIFIHSTNTHAASAECQKRLKSLRARDPNDGLCWGLRQRREITTTHVLWAQGVVGTALRAPWVEVGQHDLETCGDGLGELPEDTGPGRAGEVRRGGRGERD